MHLLELAQLTNAVKYQNCSAFTFTDLQLTDGFKSLKQLGDGQWLFYYNNMSKSVQSNEYLMNFILIFIIRMVILNEWLLTHSHLNCSQGITQILISKQHFLEIFYWKLLCLLI